ncbi:hypothetical protein DIC66_18380 [Rhodoferax lacus]|uniref:Uncharacterized protein n=1 Tax=Rhodoferax lacus TaxID=2184758 RepID=A0A3E1R7V6_9BURK|nr:hypothetical protein [Rhodoferax lacus]RFO95458.1 hypothetical protein DIC66_18380 [Rhodoferax lacus]
MPTLHQGPFVGPTAFTGIIRNALVQADHAGWSEMVWSDASFEDWPLYEKAVVEALNDWARKGRKLTLLAHHFDAMHRIHHRFVAWRIRWDHLLECRVCKGVDASEFPSALWTPTWAMRRLDPVRCTGVASVEPRMRLLLREELEERKRQSSPGFAASTLGL